MARKIEITTKTFLCTAEIAGQYLTAGETYTAEFRSNSRDVHFVRVAAAYSATYVQSWAVKQGIASGALVQA